MLQTGLVKTPDLIKRLLLLLAHQAGSEVSVNELATQLGMARPTVDRYLELLEQTFVIFRLPSFSTNPRKEIAKSQKVYFWDTGVRNALLNALSTDEFRPDIGALWESWVIAEVAKRNALLSSPAELFFWRTRAQSEVDLVVKQGSGLRGRFKGRALRRKPPPARSPVNLSIPQSRIELWMPASNLRTRRGWPGPPAICPMNANLNSEATRREFLRGVARNTALAGLALGAAYVAATRRPAAGPAACHRQSLCGGCERQLACELPAAQARRKSRKGG